MSNININTVPRPSPNANGNPDPNLNPNRSVESDEEEEGDGRMSDDEAAAIIAKKPNVQLSEKDVKDFVDQHASTKFLRLHAGCLIVNDLKRSPNGKTNRAANKEYFIRQKGIKIQKQ